MVKFLFRWLFRLTILAIVLAVAVILLKDAILKSVLESRLNRETGLETHIGRLEMGLLTPTFTIENLRVFNNAAFGGLPFLNVPEIHVEYDRKALTQGQLHLFLMRLHVGEINIVTNASGQNNLQWLSTVALAATNQAAAPTLAFSGIEVLNLTVDKVKFSNLADPRQSQEFNPQIKNLVLNRIRNAGDFSANLLRLWLQPRSNLLESTQPATAPPNRLNRPH